MSVVRLLALRDTPLDVAEVLAAVQDPAAGGVVSFTGLVRDHDGGRGVTELEYEAHPGAQEAMAAVAERIAGELPVHALAAVHRTGLLAVGDVAVDTWWVSAPYGDLPRRSSRTGSACTCIARTGSARSGPVTSGRPGP